MIGRSRSIRRSLLTTAACVLGSLVVGGVDARVAAAPDSGATTARFEAVGPVRLADTREAVCGCTVLDDGTVRVQVTGRAGVVPSGVAVAAAVTVTAVGGDRAAFVTAWPAGTPRPSTSLVNVGSRQVVANSGIVPLSTDGAIDIWANAATDLVVDVSGVFVATTSTSSGRFVAITPTRTLDTRDGVAIAAGERRVVPRPAAVPADAAAWVVNITSVGARGAGFVTAFAASVAGTSAAPGGGVPTSSVLNPDGSGAAVASSVIVPASTAGVELFSSVPTDLVVDVTGWFTGSSAADGGDGLFVPAAPVRLLDTRLQGPRLWGDGDRELPVSVPGAAALVTNLTVVEADDELFVTARAAGTPLPPTSNVNARSRGAVVANAAITAVSDRGLAWYSNVGTDLVVDMTGWFTGAAVAATEPPRPNEPRTVPVLLVGDSTLAALDVVTASQRALQGASFAVDAAPCRRLLQPSCKSAFTLRVPTTAVEAIRSAPVAPEVLVVKAGYNEGSSAFRESVIAVLSAARGRGVRAVVWLTYSEGTRGQLRTYELNNAVLRELRDGGAWPELVIADWRTYAASSSGWYSADRVHLQGTGAWATSDYIARWVAHVTHRPCPQPWVPGEAVDARCSSPDDVARVRGTPSLRALYGF